MEQITDIPSLRHAVSTLKQSGTVALVPTMGALHEGHLSLIRAARAKADSIVVSIFVNPAQFGPNEDFSAYPRQMEQDAQLLQAEEVSVLWAPSAETVYKSGFSTTVSVGALGQVLCGQMRPNHFDGVAIVVLKLFNQVQPDVAFFGEKDWQQLAVIRRMAQDLDLISPNPVQIIGVPTVRETDDLAMSSRNRYLSPEERQKAAALPQAMREAIAKIERGGNVPDALHGLKQRLAAAGFAQIDYAQLADAEQLTPLDHLASGVSARLFVAARIGKTRLIDNMPVAKS